MKRVNIVIQYMYISIYWVFQMGRYEIDYGWVKEQAKTGLGIKSDVSSVGQSGGLVVTHNPLCSGNTLQRSPVL